MINFDNMVKLFFFVFILFLVYSLYNRGNLKKYIKEDFSSNTHNFKMYFVDWCPHCINAKPHFENLKKHKRINNHKIKYYMIDCEKNPKSAEKANITGYPTLILNDKKIYEGERTYSKFLDFLNKNIN